MRDGPWPGTHARRGRDRPRGFSGRAVQAVSGGCPPPAGHATVAAGSLRRRTADRDRCASQAVGGWVAQPDRGSRNLVRRARAPAGPLLAQQIATASLAVTAELRVKSGEKPLERTFWQARGPEGDPSTTHKCRHCSVHRMLWKPLSRSRP